MKSLLLRTAVAIGTLLAVHAAAYADPVMGGTLRFARNAHHLTQPHFCPPAWIVSDCRFAIVACILRRDCLPKHALPFDIAHIVPLIRACAFQSGHDSTRSSQR